MTYKTKRTAQNFIEAKLEPAVGDTPNAGLQLMLPNGIRVAITSEISAELLKTVLTIAGAVSC